MPFFDYDVKNLIVMRKARGLSARLNCACGQGNCFILKQRNTAWISKVVETTLIINGCR